MSTGVRVWNNIRVSVETMRPFEKIVSYAFQNMRKKFICMKSVLKLPTMKINVISL